MVFVDELPSVIEIRYVPVLSVTRWACELVCVAAGPKGGHAIPPVL